MIEKSNCIILDNGSGYLKAGWSTDTIPTFTIPALVGRPMLRYEENIESFQIKPIMVGDEVIPVRSMLEIKHPMREGIIQDREEMELLWKYALFDKVSISHSFFR
jgi:actin-related protein 2